MSTFFFQIVIIPDRLVVIHSADVPVDNAWTWVSSNAVAVDFIWLPRLFVVFFFLVRGEDLPKCELTRIVPFEPTRVRGVSREGMEAGNGDGRTRRVG